VPQVRFFTWVLGSSSLRTLCSLRPLRKLCSLLTDRWSLVTGRWSLLKVRRSGKVKTPTRKSDVWGTRVYFPSSARATRRQPPPFLHSILDGRVGQASAIALSAMASRGTSRNSPMQVDLQTAVSQLNEIVQRPFWSRLDFWIGIISIVVSTGGLIYAIRAFYEAKRATRAATAAGRTVRLQTVAIELSEIIQKLERLQADIRFTEAQELLNEVSRRLRRFVSPFSDDNKLSPSITLCLSALDGAQKSLNGVRPTDPSKAGELPGVVYWAVQGDFATINSSVAALQGLFEKESFHFGDYNAER
jgi:Flp pilus assembly protein TadG